MPAETKKRRQEMHTQRVDGELFPVECCVQCVSKTQAFLNDDGICDRLGLGPQYLRCRSGLGSLECGRGVEWPANQCVGQWIGSLGPYPQKPPAEQPVSALRAPIFPAQPEKEKTKQTSPQRQQGSPQSTQVVASA